MIPNPTMIMGVALAICFAWGSAATWYAKTLVEDKAQVEAALEQANNETLKQIEINSELRANVAAERRALKELGAERAKDAIRYQKEIAKINEQRNLAERIAIENPRRYGVAATYDLLRGMRDVCRSGGGSTEDCRFGKVQAPAPSASDSGSSDIGNAQSLE